MDNVKKLYTYIDINNDMVAWETAIGRYSSVDQLELQNLFTVSLRQFSIFKECVVNKNFQKISREIEIELKRMELFQCKVSRLRGLYFFKHKEHAKAVIGRWAGSHFNAEFLSEVAFTQANYTEYDSEWITSYFTSKDGEWINNYLAGETCGTQPLTEILVSGLGVVLNTELRKRAYDTLIKKHPESAQILQLSCLGFDKGMNDIGQTVPFLLNTGKSIKGVHLGNMKQFQNGSNLFKLIDQGVIKLPSLPKDWSGNIKMPDFSHMGFECALSDVPSMLRIGNFKGN